MVRSQLPGLDEVSRSKPCRGKKPCHLCKNMKETCIFKSGHVDEIHKVNKKYNFNLKVVAVYLIECKVCGEQYTGSTKTKFRSRAINCKCTQRRFMNKEAVHKRFNGIEEWVITLIDSEDTFKKLMRKELYWMYRLKTDAPYSLNERCL